MGEDDVANGNVLFSSSAKCISQEAFLLVI